MLFRILLYLLITTVILLGVPRLIVSLYTAPRIFSVQSAPKTHVAIVFGAGLQRDGSASLVLRDRVATAAELYFSGKVDKLLMSGDNRFVYYNEPGAMLNYALSLGIPKEAIVLDYAGRRTYDTCYRARDIFKVSEVLLVTQNFHLPRALFTCDNLGIQAYGVSADRSRYLTSTRLSWELRELGATLAAFWDVWIAHPEPVLGSPEPITYQTPHSTSLVINTPNTQEPKEKP